MKTFHITTLINDGETGELIERVQFLFEDEKDEYKTAEDLAKDFTEDNYEAFNELVDKRREYETTENDIYRTTVIELEDPKDE